LLLSPPSSLLRWKKKGTIRSDPRRRTSGNLHFESGKNLRRLLAFGIEIGRSDHPISVFACFLRFFDRSIIHSKRQPCGHRHELHTRHATNTQKQKTQLKGPDSWTYTDPGVHYVTEGSSFSFLFSPFFHIMLELDSIHPIDAQ
jgi:hypothetical protein